ncbi:MAG: hypothetical protein ABI083_18625 [Lapillicoccus sp.]
MSGVTRRSRRTLAWTVGVVAALVLSSTPAMASTDATTYTVTAGRRAMGAVAFSLLPTGECRSSSSGLAPPPRG